eukprot:1736128-Amphidinium_carterae.1
MGQQPCSMCWRGVAQGQASSSEAYECHPTIKKLPSVTDPHRNFLILPATFVELLVMLFEGTGTTSIRVGV